ncbi:hypothetical protein DYB32_005750 [Aphanomyces invadans]|uniref:Uncharacterized protein n=1 Tax=Aphanomyces invadans TaxID=157072 RepID=A0A3R6ZP37_9STRA|nr:hypothetical protein DYB32_005750 [Aphanomyces invadans]
MGETGIFFYNGQPRTTIADQPRPGQKQDKCRISVALATNADGTEKLLPTFIRKSKLTYDQQYARVIDAKKFRDWLMGKEGIENVGLAIIMKHPIKAVEIDRMYLVGNASGSNCILLTT